MNEKSEIPILSFSTQIEFEKWIKQNVKSTEGIWLKFAKKNSGIVSISPEQALEIALCFGWIDGQRKSFDENYFLNRYTPRRKASLWSKRNIEIAERLIAENKMQADGLKEIERAKADGRWANAYDGQKNMEIPNELLEQLNKHPVALSFFNSLNRTNKFAIVMRLQTARKPETREKRLIKIMEMLEKSEKFY